MCGLVVALPHRQGIGQAWPPSELHPNLNETGLGGSLLDCAIEAYLRAINRRRKNTPNQDVRLCRSVGPLVSWGGHVSKQAGHRVVDEQLAVANVASQHGVGGVAGLRENLPVLCSKRTYWRGAASDAGGR